jgi:hypothetical protein
MSQTSQEAFSSYGPNNGSEKKKTQIIKPKSLEDLRQIAVQSDSYKEFNQALDVLLYDLVDSNSGMVSLYQLE